MEDSQYVYLCTIATDYFSSVLLLLCQLKCVIMGWEYHENIFFLLNLRSLFINIWETWATYRLKTLIAYIYYAPSHPHPPWLTVHNIPSHGHSGTWAPPLLAPEGPHSEESIGLCHRAAEQVCGTSNLMTPLRLFPFSAFEDGTKFKHWSKMIM